MVRIFDAISIYKYLVRTIQKNINHAVVACVSASRIPTLHRRDHRPITHQEAVTPLDLEWINRSPIQFCTQNSTITTQHKATTKLNKRTVKEDDANTENHTAAIRNTLSDKASVSAWRKPISGACREHVLNNNTKNKFQTPQWSYNFTSVKEYGICGTGQSRDIGR